MEDEDRRILVEDVDDNNRPADGDDGDGWRQQDKLPVRFHPCEASCLSIVHLASVVAAIGWVLH